MTLEELRDHIDGFPAKTVFKFGLSKPFSWRGSYDEVAFSIVEAPMSKQEVLSVINEALTLTFFGYKGGEYKYNLSTKVNFEGGGYSNYTDGGYTSEMISKITKTPLYRTQEERLVKIAFN